MNIYDFSVKKASGEEISLKEYEGKVILIFNSATRCGFTKQYDDLQDLYEKYGEEGFVVLDFPCNQFGGQAPESDEEIVSFCDASFGITFPIFSKIEVNGDNAHPLFKYLVEEKGFKRFNIDHELTSKLEQIIAKADPNYQKNPTIKWNFTKFLIDRNGNVVERFEPTEDLYVVEEKIRDLL
jgi:glutathione peroxidase